MPDDDITDFERESLRIYTLSENADPTPAFAFRFYVPHLIHWAKWYLAAILAFAWFAPSGPTLSLKTSLILVAILLFVGVVAWHVRLAYTAVAHWRLLRRVLDWAAIHRLCDRHDATSNDENGG